MTVEQRTAAIPARPLWRWDEPGDGWALGALALSLLFAPWEVLFQKSGLGHALPCDAAVLLLGATVTLLLFRAASAVADPQLRHGLRMIAAAHATALVGDLIWTAYDLRGLDPALSPATIPYLLFYPVLFAGLVSMPGLIRSGAEFWIDAGLILIAGAMVVVLALGVAGSMASASALVYTGFSLGDLVPLLAFAAAVSTSVEARTRTAHGLFGLACLLNLAGDVAYAAQRFAGETSGEGVPDALVLFSWAAMGLAAQAYRRVPFPAPEPDAIAAYWPVARVFPHIAVVVGFGALGFGALRRSPDLPGLAVGALFLTALLLSRQWLANRRTVALLEERTALRSKARFEALVESSADVVALLDTEARFQYLSASIERVLGRRPAELVGQIAFDVMHPDDVAHCQQTFAFCLANPGVHCHAEFRFRHADGSWREIEADGLNRLADRELGAIVVTFRDVTGLRLAEQELRSQKDLFRNLLEVARATSENLGLETTLRNALDVMKHVAGAEGGSVMLVDEGGALRSRVFGAGDPSMLVVDAAGAERILKDGLAGWVARNKTPAIVEDTEADPRWLRLTAEQAIRSALCVPILSGEAIVGILTLVHSRAGHFGKRDLELARAAGDQIALALRNAQVFEALGRMAGRLRLLNDFVHAAGLRLDPGRMLQAAVETIANRTRWSNVVVSVPDEERRFWKIRASAEELSQVGNQPVEAGVVGRAFASGRTQLVSDVSRDPDYVPGSPRVKSELAVPLKRGDRVLGVLNIESDEVGGFHSEDIRLAEALADTVALSLDDAQLYRKLADESERLDALIRSSRDGLLLVSGDLKVRVANQPALRLLGLPGPTASWLDRELAELAPLAPSQLVAALAEGAPPGSGEYELGIYYVRWQTVPVAAGRDEGRLLILHDVTEDRRVERLREDLTHTLVHDLRNPLNSVVGFLGLLEEADSLSPSQREMLTVATRATGRLLSMVETILDVGRLEEGAMPLERQSVDVRPLVTEVLALQKPAVEHRGITLQLDVAEAPFMAWADAGLLRRVLENLVGNALKHTPRGGVVGVRAEALAEGGLRVSVSDTGRGIQEAERERVFDKFFTGAASAGGRGSGLGLAFCRLAVEAHGGHIGVGPGNGPGAVFSFTLPAQGR